MDITKPAKLDGTMLVPVEWEVWKLDSEVLESTRDDLGLIGMNKAASDLLLLHVLASRGYAAKIKRLSVGEEVNG